MERLQTEGKSEERQKGKCHTPACKISPVVQTGPVHWCPGNSAGQEKGIKKKTAGAKHLCTLLLVGVQWL